MSETYWERVEREYQNEKRRARGLPPLPEPPQPEAPKSVEQNPAIYFSEVEKQYQNDQRKKHGLIPEKESGCKQDYTSVDKQTSSRDKAKYCDELLLAARELRDTLMLETQSFYDIQTNPP
jgi:hypothetical protein